MKKFILLFVLFMLSAYSFSALTYKEREALGKQWFEAMKKAAEKYEASGKRDRKTEISIAEKFIKEYPNEDYLYEYLGTSYMGENDPKRAEQYLLKAVELGNKDTALFTLAMLYDEQGDTEKAEETLKKIDKKFLNLSMEEAKILRELKMRAVFLDEFHAQWFLADSYATYFKNNKEAKKWAQKALEKSKKIPKSERDREEDYYKEKLEQIKKILK